MNLVETIAGGAVAGLALWYARKLFRRANGFDTPAPPGEPFARKEDVSATAGEKVPAGSPRPGIDQFKAYVLARFGGSDAGVWGDQAHQARVSDHNVGRAWDWHFPDKAARDKMLAWLAADGWDMGRRLGVGNIISSGRVWSSWIDGKAPIQRAYTGSNPHNTHVHLSFSRDGSMGKTSGYAMLRDEVIR